MKSLQIAFSFLRVPRFFITLFLIPLVLGILVFYAQLLVTGLYVVSSKRSSNAIEKRFEKRQENNLVRQLIYGSGAALTNTKVCRWIASDGEYSELPPNKDCYPDRLDVALQVKNPAEFDPSSYLQFLDGNFERVHLCKSCDPDLTIKLREGENPQTSIKSLQALLLLSSTAINQDTAREMVEALEQFEERTSLLGRRQLFATGLRGPVVLNQLQASMALTLSIASLFVIALYLALKAHRKVLDYFARSGALLPMVSSTGQKPFYGAIWSLTAIRVAAFMFAGVPLLVVSFQQFVADEEVLAKFSIAQHDFWLWLVTLFVGLALATVIASIADLKHRHNFMTFLYRYVPLILCAFGALLWITSLVIQNDISGAFRNIITSLPVLGIAPVLIAPVFQPSSLSLLINLVLSLTLIAFLFRKNSRWFAAHLEDL